MIERNEKIKVRDKNRIMKIINKAISSNGKLKIDFYTLNTKAASKVYKGKELREIRKKLYDRIIPLTWSVVIQEVD
ncbi:Uncharacterised protein [Peptostreptococcus anaerobius]|uniref:Uncharacterized protein n=1 Tax=Peptostreptococcus anaerobius TaxID=1261 RepID=A0A379CGZ3_9FIRM|nr:hypothetical protein [Peptostreptococcus anaerobius]EKX89299.1 hypothetical protein HMPREF9998_01734 [Peptostreptococcus anaerobius VPI 4330 = DSM 2949]SFM70067.1 hypothetical protein SAMN05660467_00220 [Peptostreptococcus anaerobius]SUB61016.1 Uncharacterised protein [Peptostreptococcus anaerobius]